MKTARYALVRSLLDPRPLVAWPVTTTFSCVVTLTKGPVDNETL
jgi:hypothetical protein